MGTASLSIASSTAGSVTTTREIPTGTAERLYAYFADVHAADFVDENGDPRAPTMEEVADAWFDGTLKGTFANLVRFEEEKAKKAVAAVEPIEFSKV